MKILLRLLFMEENKKGQIVEGLLWIVRILFIIIPLVLGVVLLISRFVTSVDVTPLESFILLERFSNCFLENNVLNIKDFTSTNLENCYSFNEEGAVKVTLGFLYKELEISTSEFSYLNPFCNLKGKNIPFCREYRKYVLVKDKGEFFPGTLKIKIILKKE